MSSEQIGELSAAQSYSYLPDSALSLGAFDKLPVENIINILTFVPQPLSVSLVSKPMMVFGRQALKQRLVHKCGTPVDTSCVDILLQFQVDIAAISLRTKEEALQELSLLLDHRFELLRNPDDLQKFLSDRLLLLSKKVLNFFHVELDSKMEEQMLGARSENFLASQIPSARTKEVQLIVEYLRDKVKPEVFSHDLEVDAKTGVFDECGYGRALPLQILALPPLEIYRSLGLSDLHLYLTSSPFIPLGVRRMTNVSSLDIDKCHMGSLPLELRKMHLSSLILRDCDVGKSSQHVIDTSISENFEMYNCTLHLSEDISLIIRELDKKKHKTEMNIIRNSGWDQETVKCLQEKVNKPMEQGVGEVHLPLDRKETGKD